MGKAACKKINFLNVYCNRLYTKNKYYSPFLLKKIVVKNVQLQYFPPIFYTLVFFFLFIQPQLLLHFFFPFSFFVAVCLLLCFYSFFSLYNHSSSYTFFFLLVFLLPFVYCCAFILFFPISTPCIFSKHFYTFYVLLCFIFFFSA